MLLNVAAYHFTNPADRPNLSDPAQLDDLRAQLLDRGRSLGLRGTILLAPEGINLVACGAAPTLRGLIDELRALPALAALQTKESWSRGQNFNRWLVKKKKEIITFGHLEHRPVRGRAPTVAPATLARWLDAGHDDEGRRVLMLDTRNAFEVSVGTFEGAIDPQIRSFTELPAALETHRERLRGARVVTFCTGGIRCEKAALWLGAQDIGEVVQLDGGILGYFEAVGAQHWQGECFVFDRRVSVRPDLSEGSWQQDFATREVHPAT